MNSKEYCKHQLDVVQKDHDTEFNYIIKISGTTNSTKCMDITKDKVEQLIEFIRRVAK